MNARHTLQSVTDPDGLVTNRGPSRISLSLRDVAGEPLTGLRRQEGESLTVAKAARPAVNLRRCRCRQFLGPDSDQHAPSYEAREPFSGPGKPRVPFCCTSWLSQPTGQPPGWPSQAAWGPRAGVQGSRHWGLDSHCSKATITDEPYRHRPVFLQKNICAPSQRPGLPTGSSDEVSEMASSCPDLGCHLKVQRLPQSATSGARPLPAPFKQ